MTYPDLTLDNILAATQYTPETAPAFAINAVMDLSDDGLFAFSTESGTPVRKGPDPEVAKELFTLLDQDGSGVLDPQEQIVALEVTLDAVGKMKAVFPDQESQLYGDLVIEAANRGLKALKE